MDSDCKFLTVNFEFHTSVGTTCAKPQRNENVMGGGEAEIKSPRIQNVGIRLKSAINFRLRPL
jgi:hypothetical protein